MHALHPCPSLSWRTPCTLLLALGTAIFAGCSDEPDDSILGGGRGGGGSTSVSGQPSTLAGSKGISFGGAAPGGGTTSLGGAMATGGGDCNPRVVGLLRDFKAEHPNMEERVITEKGIVAATLGTDKKPVFAGDGLKSVTTAADFDQWYRDTPGVNETFEHEIQFTPMGNGRAVYDSNMFFPLDERGFGNEGNRHNYHFTFELHMEFRYNGGEVFSFRGDDDLFVFVNNRLALDLGGVHGALSGTVDLDAMAIELGIQPGNTYPLDFFHAERHLSESNFRVETNLAFTNCTPIIVR